MAKTSKYIHLLDSFIADYENGESIRSIAEKHGVAKGTVSHLLRGRVEMRPKSIVHVLSEDEQYAICEAYKHGVSLNSLCKQYNASTSTLKKLLTLKYGIEVETTRKYENLVPYILDDYSKGLSLADISNKYGISKQCALTYINLEGKEARKYSEASLQTDTDVNYFDVLNSEKAYTLGLIYARGNALTFNTSKFIHVLMRDDEVTKILPILNRFVTKKGSNLQKCDKSSSKTVRICSVDLYDKFINMGFNDRLPSRVYLGGYAKDFIDGFIHFSTTPMGKVLRVRCKKGYKTDIKSYLESIGVGYWSNDLVIGHMSDIVKLVKVHPSLLDNIIKYTKECEDNVIKERWMKILRQLGVTL